MTTFTRDLSAPGTYRYQVAALRSAGSGTDTIQSAWAGPGGRAQAGRGAGAEAPGDDHDHDAAVLGRRRRRSGDSGHPGRPGRAVARGRRRRRPPTTRPPDRRARGSAAGQGGLLSPIQPGRPGSVKSGGATVGGPAPVGRPSRHKPPDEPTSRKSPDTGFSSELPYKQVGRDRRGRGDVGRVLVGAAGGHRRRRDPPGARPPGRPGCCCSSSPCTPSTWPAGRRPKLPSTPSSAANQPPSIARIRATAACLSRYSFQLPHLGDWTQDGQPALAGAGLHDVEGRGHVAVGGVEGQLGDAGAAGVAVVDEDRRLPRSPGGSAIETPPTSQRSQMAKSGSMPIRACSAAWAADSTATASRPAPTPPRPGPCTSRPGSTASGAAGRGRPSRGLRRCRSGAAGRRRWWWSPRTDPRCSVDRPTGRFASSPLMAMSMSWRGWVYSSASTGSSSGVGVVEVEVVDPVLAALVEVDRPGMGDVEDPGAVDGARPAGPTRSRRGGTRPRSRSAARPGRRRLGPGPVHLPGPGFEGVGQDQLPDGVVDGLAEGSGRRRRGPDRRGPAAARRRRSRRGARPRTGSSG